MFLSASGDRVAIGAYLNDGGSNAGHVRVYDLKPGPPIMMITCNVAEPQSPMVRPPTTLRLL